MTQASTIVVLEDDFDRTREMIECLRERFAQHHVLVFDNAPDTIAWLRDHLEETTLICLDHDLEPNRLRNGEVFDPGTGRDVADYLATRIPCCSVIIHTTNTLAAPGMIMALEDSGWASSQVVPYNDLEWIRAQWIGRVVKALGNGHQPDMLR